MQTQRIVQKCPKCGKELKFPEKHRGKTGMCPACSTTFVISAVDIGTPSGITTRVSRKIDTQPSASQKSEELSTPTRKIQDPWANERAATTNIKQQSSQKNTQESHDEFHITTYVKKRKK